MKKRKHLDHMRFAAFFVGDLVISAVTLAELEFGLAFSSPAVQEANRLALESLLDDIMLAPFDAQAPESSLGALARAGLESRLGPCFNG